MLIYCIENKVNGMRYIGQTTKSLQCRWKQHLSASKHSNHSVKFYNAIKKYGEDEFKYYVIDHAGSVEELNLKEEFWIRFFRTVECGYNNAYGGLNYSRTDFHRELISKGRKGMKFSKEHRENMSRVRKGKLHEGSRRTLRKKGELAGEKHYFWGKKRSAEDISKMRDGARKTPLLCNETGKVYGSITEAAKDLGVHKASISSVLNKKRNSIYGFTFTKIET
jgi:group I intron endonuclease